MSMKPTIRDVAKLANVSIGTVDRVLHNRDGVSAETAKIVKEAVKKLNYEPSKIAQALATHKKKIKLGVIYPDVEYYFWNEVYKGIKETQKSLEPYGVEIIIKTTDTYNYQEQLEALNYLQDIGVHGVATMPFHPSKLNKKINDMFEQGIPIVNFVSDAPKSKRICFVGIDNLKSGVLAGKLMELYLRGKGNIAVIGVHRDVLCIEDRVYGFVNKVQNEYPDINIIGIYNIPGHIDDYNKYRQEVTKITENIIENNPDLNGIYVTNSLTSCTGNVVLKHNKTNEIKVIGHENSKEIRDLINDGVINATIYQNQFEEVVLALNILYDYITTNKKVESNIVYTKSGIMVKENIE